LFFPLGVPNSLGQNKGKPNIKYRIEAISVYSPSFAARLTTTRG
jgi:hypothetical protein